MGVNDQNLGNVVNTGSNNNPGRDIDNNINNNPDGSSNNNINNISGVDVSKVPENLREYTAGLDTEARRQMGLKAVQATNETRRKKRSFQERMQALWNTPMSRETAAAVLGDDTDRFFPEGEPAAGDLGMARMLQETWNGNAKAAEFMRDTAGYKPVQEVSVDVPQDDAVRALMENVARRLESQEKKDN